MWAFGIALGGTTAHYCLTNALRVADAILVIPLDFLRIPLIAFVGWMFRSDVGLWHRARRHDGALLPDQRAARRRCDPGHPARLPAHSADRLRRLDVQI